jgi:hypothetical protein
MMEGDDDARVIRLLEALPLEDAVFLSKRAEPRRICQQWRLDQRDATIRAATRFLPGLEDGDRAKKISRDLRRYLALVWQWNGGPMCTTETYQDAIRRIAILNERRPIGARQIANIFEHARGGTHRSN